MSTTDRERWNEKYSQRQLPMTLEADEWLIEACGTISHWEPDVSTHRRAIDIACGLGQNSIWLAQNGWDVDGVDVSGTGLELAKQAAAVASAAVNWVEADLDDWLPQPDSYDLAVVFRFLDRNTVPQIINTGLRPGGWLVYETFSVGQLDRADSHIRNPAFTLQPGELPDLFRDYIFHGFYEVTLRDRTVQRLLAQRRW